MLRPRLSNLVRPLLVLSGLLLLVSVSPALCQVGKRPIRHKTVEIPQDEDPQAPPSRNNDPDDTESGDANSPRLSASMTEADAALQDVAYRLKHETSVSQCQWNDLRAQYTEVVDDPTTLRPERARAELVLLEIHGWQAEWLDLIAEASDYLQEYKEPPMRDYCAIAQLLTAEAMQHEGAYDDALDRYEALTLEYRGEPVSTRLAFKARLYYRLCDVLLRIHAEPRDVVINWGWYVVWTYPDGPYAKLLRHAAHCQGWAEPVPDHQPSQAEKSGGIDATLSPLLPLPPICADDACAVGCLACEDTWQCSTESDPIVQSACHGSQQVKHVINCGCSSPF